MLPQLKPWGDFTLGDGGKNWITLESFNNRRLKSQLQRYKDPQERGVLISQVQVSRVMRSTTPS